MTILAVLVESRTRENRVAVVPGEVARIQSGGIQVVVESGAGVRAGHPDSAYTGAGAHVAGSRDEAIDRCDVIAMIGPPTSGEAAHFPAGSAFVGFLPPAWCLEVIEQLRVRKVASFSFNLVPRISRAQSIDALSSQASLAGYQAAVTAADRLGRVLPMMMTAAGTLPPARVLVIGAGVAGLQAIATARRLGAAVTAYDVRPEAAEEIRSLGATPIELPIVAREGSGGYAAEQSADVTTRQQELLTPAIAAADAVITTAAVPGRPAPRLISAQMVDGMRAGSVILDLASPSGGNCEVSVDGAEIDRNGVLVIGAGDLPSQVPASASSLFARNVSSFLGLLVRDGQVQLDSDDEIVAAMRVTLEGSISHEPTRALLEGASR